MQTMASDVNVARIIDPTFHPEIPPEMFHGTMTVSLLFRGNSHYSHYCKKTLAKHKHVVFKAVKIYW